MSASLSIKSIMPQLLYDSNILWSLQSKTWAYFGWTNGFLMKQSQGLHNWDKNDEHKQEKIYTLIL